MAPFLDATNSLSAIDDGAAWAVPFPPRKGCRVTPLIEAAAMYPALEEMVLDAKASVWMSFRIFDPDTKTRSDRAKAKKLKDWSALIADAVGRGVEVRILLADFEPVLADHLHAGSWSSFLGIRKIVEGLDEGKRDQLQLMVVQHEGELGWAWRQLLRPMLRKRVRSVIETLRAKKSHDDGGLDTRPGLWQHLVWDGDTPKGWRAAGPPKLWPATYHQKFVVVDGEKAVIGGLDLDERRWDDRRHRQRANETWHDISALIEGSAVADAAAHFRRLWNHEMPRYRETVAMWTSDAGKQLMLNPLTKIGTMARKEGKVAGEAMVQLARTLSRKSGAAFAMGPRHGVRELKAAHRNIILSARERLYIEAQFFRSKDAADWVEQALRASPGLEVIVLVANTPEEIAFEGQTDNLAHRHGEYLQARALGRLLKKAGPERVGLFSLAKQQKVKGDEKKFEETRGTAYGSGLIHIHSKLLIADDHMCLLSSANINGRSFEWDTELGIIWREEGDAIGDFRRKLWGQLFGENIPEDGTLAGWRAIADYNKDAEPEARKGFVVPYQLARARRYARPYFFIPDDLV